MATSKAATVDEYLDRLDPDRRQLVESIRDTVNAHLPEGYQETMQYGMIGWSVPHELYPAGYHADPSQPLPLAALASQKNYVSLYLMGTYVGGDSAAEADWFRDAWVATGRKLDMGKSCVRLKNAEAVAFDVVGEAIARLPVAEYISRYEAVHPPAKR